MQELYLNKIEIKGQKINRKKGKTLLINTLETENYFLGL